LVRCVWCGSAPSLEALVGVSEDGDSVAIAGSITFVVLKTGEAILERRWYNLGHENPCPIFMAN
jgi:hypothetical protein